MENDINRNINLNGTDTNLEESASLYDLLSICLKKWKWFALSLIVCLGVAVLYILRTQPIYSRNAQVLIKQDSRGRNASSDLTESFANIGIFQSSTNVYNELGAFRSPDLMKTVVQKLHLEMNYSTDGRMRKNVLYGSNLPVTVTIDELKEDEFASFTMHLDGSSQILMSDFKLMKVKFNDQPIYAQIGTATATPVGIVTVMPAEGYETITEPMNVYVSHSTLKSAVTSYTSRLSVTHEDKNANIIGLSLRDTSPKRAEDVLNTLIATYNENWVKDKNQIAVSTSMFINERLGVIESDLGNVDNDISSYKSQHLLPDVQAASNMYMNQANQANTQVMALNNQLYMARYIRNYLISDSNKFQLLPTSTGIESQSLASQISEYNNLMLQRNSLVANSSTSNPLVVDMDNGLASMREAIITSIDNQIVTINEQIKTLKNYGGQATSQIASNPEQAKYLLSVERQQKVKEALYLFLLQKREENELSQAFTAYNTRIITMPGGPTRPTSPNKRNILLIALLLGLAIPAGIIYVQETTNTKLRGRKDLSKVTMPFAGEIPIYVSKKKNKGIQNGVKGLRRGFKGSDNVEVVVSSGKRDIVNEAFRVLRTNINFMVGNDKDHNVFTITSFNPGSGKSFITMNLAVSFAIKDKKVLVIDGDLRHASTSEYAGRPDVGLATYLSGMADEYRPLFVQGKTHENLFILPAGALPPNPAELLENERFSNLVKELRSQFDFIFIDCPPINIVADAHIIEKNTDRTIFIIRAGLLDRSMIPELEEIYAEKKFKSMSLILNGTKDGGGYYGNRYYHYGYYYGNEQGQDHKHGKSHRGGANGQRNIKI